MHLKLPLRKAFKALKMAFKLYFHHRSFTIVLQKFYAIFLPTLVFCHLSSAMSRSPSVLSPDLSSNTVLSPSVLQHGSFTIRPPTLFFHYMSFIIGFSPSVLQHGSFNICPPTLVFRCMSSNTGLLPHVLKTTPVALLFQH